VDVDKDLLAEAMRLTNVTTQRQAIALALQELVRVKRLERLAARVGRQTLSLTPEELKRMRRDE
jgi:Arc/MetJ family transcription regulator